jgi:hypothetical protein
MGRRGIPIGLWWGKPEIPVEDVLVGERIILKLILER